MMKTLIVTEKIDAACQVAEALYLLGETKGDFKPKWAVLRDELKKTKKTFLNSGNYFIQWTNGHFGYDLSPSEINENYGLKFSLDLDFDYQMPNLLFEMKRTIKEDKRKLFNSAKQLFTKHTFNRYYICTDADAEGERIARDYLFRFCRVDKNADVRRMWVTGAFQNPKVIKEELENALPYNSPKYNNLYDSQRVRSNGDYIQGMKPTKLLVDLYGQKLYSGRVKNTIIGLVGDRELEIKNFKPKTYYVINSIGKFKMNHFFMKEVDDVDKTGKLITKIQRSTQYFNELEKDKVVSELREVNLKGKVTRCDKKVSGSTSRPLPLSGDDFKSEMVKEHNITLEDAGNILQYLRDEGFTTYQGTNGRYFAKNEEKIVKIAYETALQVFQDDKTVCNPNFSLDATLFDDKKAKGQNHPPLHLTEKVPTQRDYEKWEKVKIPKVKEGYDLIAKRILVHFLDNDKYESVKLEVEINKHKFDATGIRPIYQGWRDFVNEQRTNTYFDVDFKEGDDIQLEDIEVVPKETTVPKLYKELDILNTLMNVSKVLNQQIDDESDPAKVLELKKAKNTLKKVEGIGTDRTREIIINELKNAELITETTIEKTKYYKLTPNGWLLYKALPPQLRTVTFTAKWEEYFEEIRRGNKTYKEVILGIDAFIKKTIVYILNNRQKVKGNQRTVTDEICPLCNKKIIEQEKIFKCEDNKYKDDKQYGCKFQILKNQKLLKAKFGIKQLHRILNGETLKAPNGKLVKLDLNNDFFLNIENPSDEIVETDKTFRLGEKFCFKNAFGKNLTKAQAKKILNDEEVTLKRISKNDKEYTVTVWLEENGKLGSSFN